LGIIFGFVALSEIKASGGRMGGRGLAIGAIITGFVGVAFYIAVFALYFALIALLFQSIPSTGLSPMGVVGVGGW
jgi:hypothetical protein